MKPSSILKIAVLAMPLLLSSCIFHKKAVKEEAPQPLTAEELQNKNFVDRVQDNVQTARFITSKVKFSVEVGAQKLTLTGNLKMKRDDVIRLQLMAFGFVEAGRIEMTKDYVLIMDRINKQYLKAPWMQIDFLRNSGLNFSSMQSLFWNELFKPNPVIVGKKAVADTTATFSTIESGDDMIIQLNEGKMDYSWLVGRNDALIKMANIQYKDRFNSDNNAQLNWDYDKFEMFSSKKFPMKHAISLTTAKKDVKLGMTLNYIGSDTEWETRTEVSNKYREVTVDEILRRFMSL
ncbi:MAG: DUF4292 domain-containing protein [Prevotella sp.]|jgi:hypothetical protein|nr:DUF4292 domain-containing protein [Prevotella sp.]